MKRREFLGGLIAATSALPRRTLAAPALLRSAAREAWLYSLPLIESARVRRQSAFLGRRLGVAAINAFGHLRLPATPHERMVTTPNVDTLYSLAFVDLGNGPSTFVLPATGKRYFSLHLMDMYTNTFAVLGTRTTGGHGGAFTVVGPRDSESDGAIRSPTPWIWALARVLVDGPGDLDAVHKIQDSIRLRASPARDVGVFAGRDADWREYFSSASRLLMENPPPATDSAVLHRIAPLGLGRSFDAGKFSSTEQTEIEAGIADAKAILAGDDPKQASNGWLYPNADLGDFGQDYVYRARTAIGTLAALPRQEAMYMRAIAPDGSPKLRKDTLRLTFAADQIPPVDAFWSLTMYEATHGGHFYLARNSINRYAIGDRTKGLRRNADGSLDIWIARQDPGAGKTENWLPAPARGPYALYLRAYLPKATLLSGAYRLPPLVPAESLHAQRKASHQNLFPFPWPPTNLLDWH